MAEAVVSLVNGRVADLIIQEVNFLYGVMGQVRAAETELQFIKYFLRDADGRQEEQTVTLWVAEVRDAAYDFEDVVENYVVKVPLDRGGGVMGALKRFDGLLKKGVVLHRIGKKLEAITTHLSHLKSCAQTSRLTQLPHNEGPNYMQQQQQLRRTYSHLVD